MSSPSEQSVVVVGGGLTGCAIALLLSRRGYRVTVLERREDFRAATTSDVEASHLGLSTDTTRRSINLALSVRGQSTLKELGLLDTVMEHAIAMNHRAMHPPTATGKLTLQPYGTRGEAIYSISRSLLNGVLLDALDRAKEVGGGGNVDVRFNTAFVGVDADGVVTAKGPDGESFTLTPNLVVGADGAYSKVRTAMTRLQRVNTSTHFIQHGYKELEVAPAPDGDFKLKPVNALHIWPRHEFMMIALPNPDKTFTCTLFAPFKTFEELDAGDDASVLAFFHTQFPDLPAVISDKDIVEQYRTNPTGALVTQRVNPWNFKDKVVLMGDAAHAIVPFYGQGMNAGLEDTLVFEEVLESVNGKLSEAVPVFADLRRPAGDAIAELSFGNYMEMRSKVASTAFLMKKTIEGVLHRMFPSLWTPLYTMVAFTRIPYEKAIVKAKTQDKWFNRVLSLTTVAGLSAAAYFLAPRVLARMRTARL